MRKYFFLKKFIFSVIFIVTITFFMVANSIAFKDEFSELKNEFSKVKSINDAKEFIAQIDSAATENVVGKMTFIETYGFLQRLMGKKEFNGFSYIKDDDGMLYYSSVTELETNDIPEYASNVKRLNDYLKSKGSNLIVVIPPAKILNEVSPINREWPINDPNNRVDVLINSLQEYDIASLDLRTELISSGLSIEEMFFKTDHHWTPLASLYGLKALVKEIKDRYDIDLDPDNYYCDLKNYHSYTYKNTFLGSTGENAGVIYSGIEDYTFYWPECDMKFAWYDYEHDDKKHGVFEKAILNNDLLDDTSDIYDMAISSIYMREIVDSDRIVNESNPDGLKIVALRDSYFSPISCFLAPMVSSIDMVWTRNTMGIDLEDYVKEHDGDIYILEIYPYNLDEVSFDFFND